MEGQLRGVGGPLGGRLGGLQQVGQRRVELALAVGQQPAVRRVVEELVTKPPAPA
jgi:hypothetical protein